MPDNDKKQKKSLFDKLTILFSTNVVVRNVGGKKLRVVDTAHMQADGNPNLTKVIDRYGRLHGSRGTPQSAYNQYNSFSSTRIELYSDYESMDADAIIASALDIYSDECLSGKTVIPLLDGTKRTLHQLFESGTTDFWLYGLNASGDFVPAKADKVIYKGKKQTYLVKLDDGTEIHATDNHVFVTANDDLVELKNLNVGGVLSNYEIISIEPGIVEDVYDIVNVGTTHVFAIETNDGGKCFVHNCTLKNDVGDVLRIKTNNDNIRKILHNLFYDILNIEYNLWPWIRNLCKYGDFYLFLDIEEGLGIKNVTPFSSYEVERQEGTDPENIYMTKFTYEGPLGRGQFENYEVAHFRLLGDTNFLPYGKSLLENARKLFKQLMLMEDAMLIHRIMRAPEKRIFKIDIGNIPPAEVDQYMQNIMDSMKKTPVVDETTGQYNLKFNMQNLLEDFFLPVRGGQAGTEIDTLPGLQYQAIDDIDYLKAKMFAALKVPKAFLGYDEGLEGKCISPDTLIPLIDGTTKTVLELISDHNNGIQNYVYSIDLNSKKMVAGKISWAGYSRMNASVVKVTLDNGEHIVCTPDHKFLTRDGQWIEAQDLIENTSLMPLYRQLSTDPNIKGYDMIYDPFDGSYKYTHRLVADQFGIKQPKNVIHHVDFNKLNNNPDNLDGSNSFSQLETNLNITRRPLNKLFDQYGLDKTKFIFEHMPLAHANTSFMNNCRESMGQYLNHKVSSVELLSDTIDTCDLTIDTYHNFATNAGVIIHNSTLAALDIRFARSIERIQRIVVSELTKIAVVHLYAQGYHDADLVDFELSLTGPSIIYEQEKIASMKEKVDLAKSLIEGKLLSLKYIYANIFNLSDDEALFEKNEVIEDIKHAFRQKQIEDEGNDPAITKESFGTPHDIATMNLYGKGGQTPINDSEMPEGGWPGAGRPAKNLSYGTDDSLGGRDPIGKHDIANTLTRDTSISHKYRGGSPLAVESLISSMSGLMGIKIKSAQIISESLKAPSEIDDQIETSSMLDETKLLDEL